MRWLLALMLVPSCVVVCTASSGDQPPVFVLKWGSLGSGPGQFYGPAHIAVDRDSQVYVVDEGNNRIQKFSSAGVFLTEWGSFGNGAGQFDLPGAIAVDSDSEVFVGDVSQRIQVFTSDGAYLRQWSLAAGGDSPRGLAIGSDGTVYVMSWARQRVLKFSNEGALQGFWGSPGFDDGEFNDPRDIALNSQNNVYVADADRIQKFTSDGVFLLKWTGLGEGVRGIAADVADNIYVTDFKFAKVKQFTSNGTYLTEWGSYGVDDGEFESVNGVATGPGREIYVGDTSLHRIQKFACPFVAVEPESWGQIKGRYRATPLESKYPSATEAVGE